MEPVVTMVQVKYFNGETWHKHKSRKSKKCFQNVDDPIRVYCGNIVKIGEYYWQHRDRKEIYCQNCKEIKERKIQEKIEQREKESKERIEKIIKTEYTPEKITERIFDDCKKYNADPLDIIRLMQNRIDLS